MIIQNLRKHLICDIKISLKRNHIFIFCSSDWHFKGEKFEKRVRFYSVSSKFSEINFFRLWLLFIHDCYPYLPAIFSCMRWEPYMFFVVCLLSIYESCWNFCLLIPGCQIHSYRQPHQNLVSTVWKTLLVVVHNVLRTQTQAWWV